VTIVVVAVVPESVPAAFPSERFVTRAKTGFEPYDQQRPIPPQRDNKCIKQLDGMHAHRFNEVSWHLRIHQTPQSVAISGENMI